MRSVPEAMPEWLMPLPSRDDLDRPRAHTVAGEKPKGWGKPKGDGREFGWRRSVMCRARGTRNHLVSEGLIVYFEADGAAELARDLSAVVSFRLWVTDLASPALLKMLQKAIGSPLVEAGSPLKFAPHEGPEFFAGYGWKVIETRSLLQTAAKLKRLSLGMRLLSLLPDPAGRKPDKPWGGVCVLENSGPTDFGLTTK